MLIKLKKKPVIIFEIVILAITITDRFFIRIANTWE